MTHAKPAFLREAYRRLTDDASAASSLEEAEVNSRVAQVLDTEDPDLAWDLRVRNTGSTADNHNNCALCEKSMKFLE